MTTDTQDQMTSDERTRYGKAVFNLAVRAEEAEAERKRYGKATMDLAVRNEELLNHVHRLEAKCKAVAVMVSPNHV